jgi:hypothetical protein
MKYECEVDVGMTSLSTKQQRIKLVDKLLIVVKLGKVTSLGCIHVNIWVLDIQEGAWAKKVGLASFKNATRLTSMNLW